MEAGGFVVGACDDPPMLEPRHPHAWITVDALTWPGIVIGWVKIADANGIFMWMAECVWFDGEVQRGKVMAAFVRRA